MVKSGQVRETIILKAAEIIHRKGYHNTGIQEILKAAEIPKGSFYYYFKSKDDLGLAIIDFFLQGFTGIVRPILDNPNSSPLQRIDKLFSWFIEYFRSKGFTCGCPIGNLAQETSDINAAFRDKLSQVLETMAGLYVPVIWEAQQAGEIDDELDPWHTACFIVSAWQGALIRMKAVSSGEPLEICRDMLLNRILIPKSPSAVHENKLA